MQLTPYLSFAGDCAAAFRFYEKVLGGKLLVLSTYGESPGAEHAPPGWGEKIMHGRLQVGDTVLMGSDSPPDYFQKPAGISLALTVADAAEGRRLFDALAEGGQVTMPFEETFWAAGFGVVTDRFGIPWMVNAGEKEGGS